MKHPPRTALTGAAALSAALCAGLLPATADASAPAPRPAAQRHSAANLRAALAGQSRSAGEKARPAQIYKVTRGARPQKVSALAAGSGCPGSATFHWDWNTSLFSVDFTEAHSVITITPCWTPGTQDLSGTLYASISTTNTDTGNAFSSDQIIDGGYQIVRSDTTEIELRAVEKVAQPCGLPGADKQCVKEQVTSTAQIFSDGYVNVNSDPPPFAMADNDPAFVAHDTSGVIDDYTQYAAPPAP